jgi:hypothetical protein
VNLRKKSFPKFRQAFSVTNTKIHSKLTSRKAVKRIVLAFDFVRWWFFGIIVLNLRVLLTVVRNEKCKCKIRIITINTF